MVAINESPHFGLDVAKYVENNKEVKTPDEIAWDLTYFCREARNAPFQNRANAIVLSLEKFGELVKPKSDLSTDMATSAIYRWAEQTAPAIRLSTETHPPATLDILGRLLPLVDFNPQSIMAWLSPKGRIYQETRINIYQIIEINGQKYLFFWSAPSSHTDQECLAFHQNLLPYAETETLNIDDVETLRISPLPIQVPKSTTLTNFLNDKILFPEVWDAIANGQIVRETIDEFPIIRNIVLQEYGQIIRQKSEYESRVVGARLEMAAQEKLNMELRSNIHGDLNMNALSSPGVDFLLTTGRLLSEGANPSAEKVHCGRCGEYARGQKFSPGFKCPKKSGND